MVEMLLKPSQIGTLHSQWRVLSPLSINLIDLLDEDLSLISFFQRLGLGLAYAVAQGRCLSSLRGRECCCPCITNGAYATSSCMIATATPEGLACA